MMTAFLMVPSTLSVRLLASLIVANASRLIKNPMHAAARNSGQCARAMAVSPAAIILGHSVNAAPNISHTKHAGPRYMTPSKGPIFRPTRRY